MDEVGIPPGHREQRPRGYCCTAHRTRATAPAQPIHAHTAGRPDAPGRTIPLPRRDLVDIAGLATVRLDRRVASGEPDRRGQEQQRRRRRPGPDRRAMSILKMITPPS